MNRPTIPLLAATDPRGGTVLRAPKVGEWSDHPQDGVSLQPGSAAGTLTQLRRRFVLLIPEGVAGRVELVSGVAGTLPVEFGQPLFRVTPHSEGEARARAEATVAARARGGPLAVVSPTDGVFYGAPAAGAKPYVAAGDRVSTGQPVGLIEVMKTFNPIAYAGVGLPDEAVVVEVLAADGQEVRAGEALVVVKAL
jgi:acetyl-CoA carboxylase biotin carboxyl carrier protein